MRRRLDTNTWIALAVETHAMHGAARRWYDAEPLTAGELLFCRATEISFLRLVTQARVMNACGVVPLTNAEAVGYLDNLYRDPAVARADEPRRRGRCGCAWRVCRWRRRTSGWTPTSPRSQSRWGRSSSPSTAHSRGSPPMG